LQQVLSTSGGCPAIPAEAEKRQCYPHPCG